MSSTATATVAPSLLPDNAGSSSEDAAADQKPVDAGKDTSSATDATQVSEYVTTTDSADGSSSSSARANGDTTSGEEQQQQQDAAHPETRVKRVGSVESQESQSQNRRMRRRLSFADEHGAALSVTTYHQNLHYAVEEASHSSSSSRSGQGQGGCCVVS